MNKYCIAICDDEEPVRCLLREWTRTSTPGAEVREYSGGKELLRDIDEGLRLDVLFLDIALEESDGFETAKELEKKIEATGKSMRASRPLIIFVTGIPDRMGDAFEVKAFDYLIKPVSKDIFESDLHRAIEELKRLDAQLICETSYHNKEDFITVQIGKESVTLRVKDILYVESSGRKAVVHMKDKRYEIYRQMAGLEEELGKEFFRIHRGYLVNMKHIKGYSRSEVQIDNGDLLIISKYKYQEFVKAYMDYIS